MERDTRRISYVNCTIIAINVIYFLYLEIAGSSENTAFMISKGAMYAPLVLEEEGLASIVCKEFGLGDLEPDLAEWTHMVDCLRNPTVTVNIALVGKYVALHDAYLSVVEALTHGGIENDVKVNIRWVDSETVTDGNAAELLDGADGVLVPGGFGSRGIEGKICAADLCRRVNIPYLGICLGMQVAVIAFARSVCGLREIDGLLQNLALSAHKRHLPSWGV